ncbi:Serine/threonine-protein kinase 19 [Geranomyces michiganensis]|nr:Serine/threonine-protein kinase 19 [Geranomyces michiganensis]
MTSPHSKGKRLRGGPPPSTHNSLSNPRIQALLDADSAAALMPAALPTASFTNCKPRPKLRKSLSALDSSPVPAAVHPTRILPTKTLLETMLYIRDSLPLSIPPLITVHQLHGALGHATCDDEIAKLEAARAVRRFKVGNLGELCVMLVCDYEDQIRGVADAFKAARRAVGGGGGDAGDGRDVGSGENLSQSSSASTSTTASISAVAAAVRGPGGESPRKKLAVEKPLGRNVRDDVFDRFLTYATKPTTGLFITKAQLIASMSATEDEIGELFTYGFLTLKDVDTYWVTVRNAGVFWAGFARGRTEVLQTLKRRKHGEMLKADLEEKLLRGCAVPVQLILLDLLGKASIESLDAPLGTVMRLKNRGTANLSWT